MINNMELLLPYIYFNEGNNMFMHCQIVQRAKDHKGEKVKEGALKTYFIRSREHLQRVMPEIILLCEHYGARAYINMAGKDFYALQKLMLRKLAFDISEDIVRNPRKTLNSAAGELKSRTTRWIIDVDDPEQKDSIYNWLKNMWGDETSMYVIEVPTVQCCHFITPKFNTKDFSEAFPNVDVHKNSMGTLLYFPESIKQQSYEKSIL
jgi:hypothetical protein